MIEWFEQEIREQTQWIKDHSGHELVDAVAAHVADLEEEKSIWERAEP